jgi:beta-galactosidase
LKDVETVRFGIRKIKYSAEKGFELNGKVTKFKGVCLHHDLGPIGTAINLAALRRQLTILKDLGCNAIRSSHNMPSFEQLELCDEMGFLFLAESFDEWKKPKVQNGYNLYFDEWAEKDVVNLVQATRNHPSIVMWSSGNEVPDQWGSEGVKRAKWLQDIFHREDPTRPVTVGMDQVKAVMESGFGAIMDVPGIELSRAFV